MDIKQFTVSKAPRSDMQFAAVVAYYYRFAAPEGEQQDTISAEDLTNAARLVGRRRPGRITLNNAKSAGYLDSVERGTFRITNVGENLVVITLPGGAGEGGASNKRRRKKAAKKKYLCSVWTSTRI